MKQSYLKKMEKIERLEYEQLQSILTANLIWDAKRQIWFNVIRPSETYASSVVDAMVFRFEQLKEKCLRLNGQ